MTTLYHRNPGASEAATSPTKTFEGWTSDGNRLVWRVTWIGTKAQIDAFSPSGIWSSLDKSGSGAAHTLTATYDTPDAASASTDTTYQGSHVSEHWNIYTETVEKLYTEHPSILPEGYDTGDSALSHKYVTREQRELLAALIDSFPRPKWTDPWDPATGDITTPFETVQTQFEDAEDAGDSSGYGVAACKRVYYKVLQTGRKTYTYREYVISRTIRYNRNYTGAVSGIDPADVLKQVNAFGDVITDFASVSSVPQRIGETLSDLAKDNSLPDLGYNVTTDSVTGRTRPLKKFLKTAANFDESPTTGDVDIFESWRLVDDPDPDFYLEL